MSPSWLAFGSVPRRPARAAPEPGLTSLTTTPFTPSRAVTYRFNCWSVEMPRRAGVYSPWAINCGTTRVTVLTGMAKPMPAEVPEGLAIWLLMPMTRPRLSSRGPPELPVLMAASTWMTSSMMSPVRPSIWRLRAEMIPVVRVAL